MKRYVLDSYAVLAYAEVEEGAQTIANILKKALSHETETSMSVVNWGEVYYIIMREEGKQKAELFRTTFSRYPVNVVDADREITLQAAKYKAVHKISYADAFAAALAKLRRAVLLTGDREFKSIENDVEIMWI